MKESLSSKDSTLDETNFKEMYPEYDKWREIVKY